MNNNYQKNKDIIGTRLILNLPKLEPILLGKDIGTKLILGLSPLPPVIVSENSEVKEHPLVRKKVKNTKNLH